MKKGRGHVAGGRFGSGTRPGMASPSEGGGNWTVYDSFQDRKMSGRCRAAGPGTMAEHNARTEAYAPQFSGGETTDGDTATISPTFPNVTVRQLAAISMPRLKKSGTTPSAQQEKDQKEEAGGVQLGDAVVALLERCNESATPQQSLAMELKRTALMRQLMSYYEGLLRKGGWPPEKTKGQREAFIRWVFERKSIEQKLAFESKKENSSAASSPVSVATSYLAPLVDPVLPGKPVEVSTSLLREVSNDAGHLREGSDEKKEKCEALVLQVAQEALKLREKFVEVHAETIFDPTQQEFLPSASAIWREDTLVLSKKGTKLGEGTSCHELLVRHGRRLQFLYRHFLSKTKNAQDLLQRCGLPDDDTPFATRCYAMFERYRAISGVKPNEGSGHHAAIPPQIHEVLEKHLETSMEMFASPFNSHCSNYCSLFADTDCYFGSVGSFFEFFPIEGSFEANPPFVEEVMEDMRVHMEHLLSSSEKPLSFTVVIPAWMNPVPPSTAKIEENTTGFLRRRILVPAEGHIYLDGFQHCLRDAPFKPVHDTLVLILQNDAGAKKWPASEAFEAHLLGRWKELADTVKRPFPLQPSANVAETATVGGGGGGGGEDRKRVRE